MTYQEGDAVYWARILALMQAVGCGAATFVFGALAVDRAFPNATSFFVGALALTVAGVAFIFRQRWARLFIAGMYALMALGWGALAVLCLFDTVARWGILIIAIPLSIAITGAFVFVSVKVRRYCGEQVGQGGRPPEER